MTVNFELMKSSYACIKDATCDKCKQHTDQVIISSARSANNAIYFCPSPERKTTAKSGSGAKKNIKVKK